MPAVSNSAPLEGSLERALGNGARLLHSDPSAAAKQARAILERNPGIAAAHRLLAAAMRRLGDARAAAAAESDALMAASLHVNLFEARIALASDRLGDAERLIRTFLETNPQDPVALRLLAEIAARTGHRDQARNLLETALQMAPNFAAARADLEAITRTTDDARPDDPPDTAACYAEAIALYELKLERTPEDGLSCIEFGHLLRTIGRNEASIEAYRRAVENDPTLGQGWWSLADLKTVHFSAGDIAAMRQALATPGLDGDREAGLHYALGKALADEAQFEEAFRHYQIGAEIRRWTARHDADAVDRYVTAAEALFTRSFFADRVSQGHPAPDPVFIIGLPRSGSTLIEQILASHSQVEGTIELHDMPDLAKVLAEGKAAGLEDSDYLDRLAALSAAEVEQLGAAYLWGANLRRRTSRPFFTDKMPNNWLHVGLIALALPNAKIIDARRHPMACCFSNFTQNFARGQAFSFDLAELGRFYRSYSRLLAHFDDVLPGRVHRVFHESLVDDPENEVRRLLDHLALPFEEGCLRFFENKRAVRTSSSEQVRQPINRAGLDRWKDFSPWLEPLREALGPALDQYPSLAAGADLGPRN